MDSNNFKFNTKDIQGRLAPGFIILLNIYWMKEFLLKGINILDFYNNYTILFFIVVIVASYSLGVFNQIISFKLRSILFDKLINRRLTLRKFLKMKLPKGENIIELMEEEFGPGKLKENFWKLHWVCRECTVNKTPDAFKRAEQFSEVIFFEICMILPLILTSVLSFINTLFVSGIILFLAAVTYAINSEIKRRDEAEFIYLNYYHYRRREKSINSS